MGSERVELAKHCCSRDWSKAIRVLDSLLAKSCTIQDVCNRAFCYSQLELHKHVIKDCDKALQLEPTLLQAHILKGRALSALGRKDDALVVLEQGYEYALRQSSDLKQFLELEELLKVAKPERNVASQNTATDPGPLLPIPPLESSNVKLDETSTQQNSQGRTESCFEFKYPCEPGSKNGNNNEMPNGTSDKGRGQSSSQVSESGAYGNGKPYESLKSSNESNDQSRLSTSSKDPCKIGSISGEKLDPCELNNGLSYKGKENENTDRPSKATHEAHKACRDPTSRKNLNEKSDLSSELILSSSKSNSKSGSPSKLRSKTDTYKRPVMRISKNKSISVDFRLSRGIEQVNEGNYAYAISLFDQILREDPSYPEALIGRGTAYAFQRELEAAIADFTKAIQSNPLAGEAWKRRGQARAALGESIKAIEDLTKALEFEPMSADILHERGIVNFKFKDFNSSVEDLSACLNCDKDNKSAYTYLGLALASIGEYKKAEEAHLKAIQLDRNYLEAWGHLAQFYQELAYHKEAFDCLQQVLQIDNRFSKAYHLRGLVLHGMGEHRKAIKELSVGLSIESSSIEMLYLRASCFHAVGEYKEAIKDYDAALDVELDAMEKFVLQCLAFYQKEIALYTASKVNSEFYWFAIDGDIDPMFKEYWCKRLHPKNVCERVYRQPTLRESLKKGKLRKQDLAITKQKMTLLLTADEIGQKIQYNCPGFIANRRQHRMAGLAAIEIAQKVSKAWRSMQAEWRHSNKTPSRPGKRGRRRERINLLSQNRGGAGCTTSSSSDTSTSYATGDDRLSGRAMMSWKDVYTLAVRWRQISEPCDPVVWVNKLSEEFNSGFGSHTPMLLGQAKVVRYFPYYERTLKVAKSVIKDKRYVHNKADGIIDLSKDEKLQDIMHAETCADIHKVIDEDFWLATWCNSTALEGKKLEGTRITCLKTGEGKFDFAIRTPCTPSRWDEYDSEMSAAWEALCDTYCGENFGSTDFDVLENVRDAILKMAYYWYNFMPLSRGTAAVGFVVLLGLLLAANMEFTGNIPKGVQVDWEAILNHDPTSFVDSVKSWLYPSLRVTTSWKDHPDVSSTLPTTGSVVAALSTYQD